ncbi:Nardilysin (Narginine dibasic convertase), partial [Caligus rogercresseyi]
TLALDLSAGNSGYGFDNNSTGTIFSISVELTQKGFHELDSVIQAIYSYISMISAEGPSPRIYEEIQRMQQIDFDFGDEPQPLENVITLCEGMQILPSIRYLDGHRLLFEFDKEGLQTLTEESFLKNPNVNIMISAKEFKDSESENSVPWFKTKYIVEDISPERLTGWRKPLPEGFFKLSSENTFIPRNMDLISEEKSSPMIPSKMNVQGGELFYKRDESFGLPRAYAYFHFCTELIEKPEDAVCLDLMVDIINQQMKEDTYSACVAKLHFSLTSCEQGIVLKISGYNDRLSHLLSVIMSHITNFESLLNPERFLVIKAQTKKNYFNSFTKASNLVQDLRLSLLKFAYHGAQARHATIEFIDAEALCAFSRAFKAKAFIQALVQGNVSSAGAEELFQLASGIRSQNTESPKEIQCKETPGILPTDNNTFVTNYYQFGLAKLVDQALFDLLAMMMDEPVFDVLRTKEQLGYYVFSLLRNTHGVFGIEVTVNSQENKFSVDHVEGRISAFLKRFYEEDICGMSQSKFEEYLGSLIKKKLTSDVTLEEEVRRNWKEITSKDYIFDRNSQEAALLQKNAVSLEDIKGMVKRLFIDPESMRKLSFQVVGVETKVESNSASLPLDKKYNMDLTTVPERKDVFVSDLCTFKENCTNYPVNH